MHNFFVLFWVQNEADQWVIIQEKSELRVYCRRIVAKWATAGRHFMHLYAFLNVKKRPEIPYLREFAGLSVCGRDRTADTSDFQSFVSTNWATAPGKIRKHKIRNEKVKNTPLLICGQQK